MIVTDAQLAVRSANASAKAANNPYETVLVTDNHDAGRTAREQVIELAKEAGPLTGETLIGLQAVFKSQPRASDRSRSAIPDRSCRSN
jgi:hypothetical protein